jgi:hypothetical protein
LGHEKKSLLTTNKFLKDRSIRDRLLVQTVVSSSAIEGVGRSAKKALEADKMRIDRINHLVSTEEILPKQS